MTCTLIDSHAHVADSEFDDDREEVLTRARDAGVKQIIVVGSGGDMATAERAVALAESRDGLFATVGVHPHDAARFDPAWWPMFRKLAERESVVAIGETGLDYYYDNSPRDAQRRVFGELMELSRAVGKPVVCHIRDAHEEARVLLAEHPAQLADKRVLIHCFTGEPEDAAAYVAMGCYVSFSGIVTFKGKKSDPLREAIRRVPLDRLLIETDCPYLAPAPKRGQRNEPALVVYTAEAVAREADVSLAELARRTVANTRTFFSLK